MLSLVFRGQRHRVRILFGTADVVLIALAFWVAYLIRARLNLENNFFISWGPWPHPCSIWSMVIWVATGAWW